MKTTPKPVIHPLVSEALRLRAELSALLNRRDSLIADIVKDIAAKNEEFLAAEGKLIALGAGRYSDENRNCVSVVAEVAKTKEPDTFALPDESKAREIVTDRETFLNLFNREVIFTPKEGFKALSEAFLTPAKARDLVELCLVPGGFSGGKKAHVRWK